MYQVLLYIPGPFNVNQKWPFSGLKWGFSGFQNQAGLEPEFWKAGFEKLGLKTLFRCWAKKEMTEK